MVRIVIYIRPLSEDSHEAGHGWQANKRCFTISLSLALGSVYRWGHAAGQQPGGHHGGGSAVDIVVQNTRFCVLTASAKHACTAYGVKSLSPAGDEAAGAV